MRTALTIAGSDSGGGAGIQADLKSFAALGLHGCSVVTVVTAQNTVGVDSIYPLPLEEIAAQLKAVLKDIPVHAAKTGMLYSGEIVETVARGLRNKKFPLVVDPVMVATVGASLQREDFRDALKRHLLPMATLVTPNLQEASELVGFRVFDVQSMKRAADVILSYGAGAVLVKGGHLRGNLVDIFHDGEELREFKSYRFPKDLHGSGCMLAASIAGYLALGKGLGEAVSLGRRRVAAGFSSSYAVGKGVNVVFSHYRPERYEIWKEVQMAAGRLCSLVPLGLVPEVGINIGYALPAATDPDEVCALRGRLTRIGDRLVQISEPEFGASKHIARIVLTAMRYNPSMRSAANLKYVDKNLTRAKKIGLRLGTFDRKRQPRGTMTMEWGTEMAIREAGEVPDVIYDVGDVGKEPMMRFLGQDPRDVVQKIRRFVKE